MQPTTNGKTVYDYLKCIKENLEAIRPADHVSTEKKLQAERCFDELLSLIGFHLEGRPILCRICPGGDIINR